MNYAASFLSIVAPHSSSWAGIRVVSADIYHFISFAPVSLIISEWNVDHYYTAVVPAKILLSLSLIPAGPGRQ